MTTRDFEPDFEAPADHADQVAERDTDGDGFFTRSTWSAGGRLPDDPERPLPGLPRDARAPGVVLLRPGEHAVRRRRPPSGALLALALLAGCAAGAAGAADSAPARHCAFGAFADDDDPAGLNVRAEPGTAARVLGTLPPVVVDHANGDFRIRVPLEVRGVRDGWFRIAGARDDDALTGKPPRPTYAGEGWVSGRKLAVKSQATLGHARPDAASPVRLRMADGQGFDSDTMVTAGRLVDCAGAWALVEVDETRLPSDVRAALTVAPEARAGLPAGHFRAWVDRVCGLQETRCDGG